MKIDKSATPSNVCVCVRVCVYIQECSSAVWHRTPGIQFPKDGSDSGRRSKVFGSQTAQNFLRCNYGNSVIRACLRIGYLYCIYGLNALHRSQRLPKSVNFLGRIHKFLQICINSPGCFIHEALKTKTCEGCPVALYHYCHRTFFNETLNFDIVILIKTVGNGRRKSFVCYSLLSKLQ